MNAEIQTLVQQHDTSQLEHNLARLDDILALQNNWNGYGAPRIEAQVVEHVRQLLHRIARHQQPTNIVPTGRGTIQLEYEDRNGKYLELDVGNESVDILYQPLEGDEIEEEEASVDRAMSLIQHYYAG